MTLVESGGVGGGFFVSWWKWGRGVGGILSLWDSEEWAGEYFDFLLTVRSGQGSIVTLCDSEEWAGEWCGSWWSAGVGKGGGFLCGVCRVWEEGSVCLCDPCCVCRERLLY